MQDDTKITGMDDQQADSVNEAGVDNANGAGGQSTAEKFQRLLKDDPALQGEFDRLNAKALETGRRNWEKAAEKKRSEAEELARMSGEQRSKREIEMRQQEIDEKERLLNRRELRTTAIEELAKRKLDTGLVDNINYDDAETCNKSIDALERAFRASVKAAVEFEVNERLKSAPPKAPSPGADATASIRKAMGLKT